MDRLMIDLNNYNLWLTAIYHSLSLWDSGSGLGSHDLSASSLVRSISYGSLFILLDFTNLLALELNFLDAIPSTVISLSSSCYLLNSSNVELTALSYRRLSYSANSWDFCNLVIRDISSSSRRVSISSFFF